MSVFVNQGPWPWPSGHTQTGHTARRRRRRSSYGDGAWPCQCPVCCAASGLASSGAGLAAGPAGQGSLSTGRRPAQAGGPVQAPPSPATRRRPQAQGHQARPGQPQHRPAQAGPQNT